MKRFYRRGIIVMALTLVAGGVSSVQAQNVLKSTLDDQESLELTIYNKDLALVKDTRRLTLPEGTGELRFMDVAEKIMPVTVHIESVSFPEAFRVLEQNYEYDLMSENKLLDKYVGKTIQIANWDEDLNQKKMVDAILLSNNQGQIYQIGDDIYLGHPGYKVLPKIPGNLIAKPTLMWLYHNKARKPQEIKVSYLTNSVNWKADYVLVLGQDDQSAGLTGWVTVNNRSGATYQDAKLKLIAGDVNRVTERRTKGEMYELSRAMDAESPAFVEESFFEYHIYDLQRKTTVKDNQTKQIQLLEAHGIEVQKELIAQGSQNYFVSNYGRGGAPIKVPVNVYIKFKNKKVNQLGIPLPAGIMRLYKEDSRKSLQFIGEDRIDHTPKDEEVKLKIGEAFDVVVERVQKSYLRPSKRKHESEWEVAIRNHKKEDVVVTLLEPMRGSWKLMSTTHKFTKPDAFTARFDVKVPQDGEVIVKYKVVVNNY